LTKGNCDHRLDPLGYNEVTLDKGGVIVDVRWTWDFTSVYPDCDGPIIQVHVTNPTQVSYYYHVQRRRGGTRDIEIPPGTDQVLLRAALLPLGIDTLGDMAELTLTTSPTVRAR
jgi:hypothetical protein